MNKERPVSFIQISNQTKVNYFKRIRGRRSETKQLNIHVKTLNKKFIRRILIFDDVGEQTKNIYQNYLKMKANFDTTEYLFEELNIR